MALIPAEARRRRLSPMTGTAALSVGMLLAAATLLVLVVPQLPVPGRRFDVPWWLVAPLFSLGELFVVHLRVRRSAFTVSFGHVPLVLGLGLLNPAGFLLAALAGSALTLLLLRRQRGLKLLFNAALWAFEATLAVSLYGTLAAGASPHEVHALFAALTTIVVTDQLTALALTTVISLHEGAIDRETLREAVSWGLAVAVSNTSVGLLVVVLIQRQPSAVPLLGVVLVVLAIAYRAYAGLGAAHTWLEQHHAFARAIARTGDTGPVIELILQATRDLLDAERAELHLGGAVHAVPHGTDPGAYTPTAFWRDRLQKGALAVTREDQAAADMLTRACASEVAAVEIHVGDVLGVLVALEPMGETRSFGVDALLALETLAGQAGVALENDALVTRLRREAAEREHESLHDALTGLPNRRALTVAVDAAVAQGGAAVLLLDLAGLKDVNDALGHTVGDELLQVVGERLRAALPERDLVARIGSDEFAVLLAGKDAAAAIDLAVLRITESLDVVASVHDVELHVSACIGSAVAPHDARDAEELLQRADTAMYRCKEARTAHERYDAVLDRSSTERLALYTQLRHAIDAGLLTIYLQPSVHPRTEAVLGAEALVRWPHARRGHVPPDEFVPVAEGSGLIRPLTLLVLDRALAELAPLRAAGLLDAVAVNLSPRVLDADLPAQVTAALQRAGLPPECLTLEVTETTMMIDPEAALGVLGALDALGVRLSVDDFGTGWSSLTYLRTLPVDELKIDRSFVTNLAADAGNQAIVRSTIELAHALGLSVVAEGVEDGASLALLADWGCEAAQGYHLSRPLPPQQLASWLRERARIDDATPDRPPLPRTPQPFVRPSRH